MNVEIADSPLPQCPRCRAELALGTIGGLCPNCLAQAAGAWLAPLPTAPPTDDALFSVPGWRITGVLGAGGMGRVYGAEAEADGTPAAIKVLEARWSAHPAMAARFEAEAEALRCLDHPHIVKILETTETEDGRLCLVMELVAGCDLGSLLRAEKLLPERAMDLFRKVCAAVAHAHELGFLHRDIKPSNILVGHQGTVKLADFGLAKNLATSGGEVSAIGGLTATTDQFGTAYYLAPERMMAGKKAGPAADVFSLGVLLYHLLAGQMPLGKYTPLSRLTSLPAKLDGIVAKALEAEPARRTASVAELEKSVASVWHDHVTGAGRARKWKQAAAVLAALLFVVAAAGGGAWWQHERSKPPPQIVFAPPSSATAERPWENGLGMRFVPVAGAKVLFSVWETRRRDYDPYRRADRAGLPWHRYRAERVNRDDNRISQVGDDGAFVPEGSWDQPRFPVTPEHPAHGIGIRDAQHFCIWLTMRDQAENRLTLAQYYRLPTSAEWLAACGGEDAPLAPGNRAGQELADPALPRTREWAMLPGRDPFVTPSPVGAFPPERHGLYDLAGNLSEWVQDEQERFALPANQSRAVVLGPNFIDGQPGAGTFRYRSLPFRAKRIAYIGFRVVLEHNPPPENPAAAAEPRS